MPSLHEQPLRRRSRRSIGAAVGGLGSLPWRLAAVFLHQRPELTSRAETCCMAAGASCWALWTREVTGHPAGLTCRFLLLARASLL